MCGARRAARHGVAKRRTHDNKMRSQCFAPVVARSRQGDCSNWAKQLFFCNLTESDLRSDSPVV